MVLHTLQNYFDNLFYNNKTNFIIFLNILKMSYLLIFFITWNSMTISDKSYKL